MSAQQSISRQVVHAHGYHTQEAIHQIIADDMLAATLELVKVLKRHQYSKKWVMLIAPPHLPTQALLSACQIRKEKLLLVHATPDKTNAELVKQALGLNNISAVISWNCETALAPVKSGQHCPWYNIAYPIH